MCTTGKFCQIQRKNSLWDSDLKSPSSPAPESTGNTVCGSEEYLFPLRGIFADFAPILHVSAVTGERAPKVMEMVQKVCLARGSHIATPELNRFFARVTKRTPPRSPGKHEVKIQYGTQVGTKPPRFAIFTNTKTKFHFSYERFLKNQLRETFDFIGTPIRLRVRTRKVSRGQR